MENEKKKTLEFRPLNANEIEIRVGTTVKQKENGKVAKDEYGNDKIKGFFLLLYKNARVDQVVLDETVGTFNWQCKYYQVKNTMVCSVGIYNEERGEWLWKDNGGDDDFNTEQVKAELSDSFKRACFNWGIGRELYYAPKIYVATNTNNTTGAHYSVKQIQYDNNKRITRLVIINDSTKDVVYTYGVKGEEQDTQPKQEEPKVAQANEEKGSIDPNDLQEIRQIIGTYTRDESRTKFFKYVEDNYGAKILEHLTLSQGKAILKVLKK